MLSTLAIISIFTEIFAAGILVAGAGAFFKRFFALKKTADLFLGLVFFCLFIYVSATIASQMLFNLGREVSLLIFIHKIIYISLAFCAVMIWFYVIEHFELTKLRWTRVLILLLAAVLVFFVLTASTSLIYREDIIEPIVSFAFYLPVKPFLVFAWLFFALVALLKAAVDRRADRAISVFLGAAAVVMLLGMLSSILYVNFGEAVYLIASWFLVLLSTLAFLAAGLVPADSPEAHYPWLFFRTRILFKLMLIFVLLIVILFEATTLATINISKHALSQSIIKNYLRVAEDFADEVQLFTELPSKRFIQKLVSSSKINGQEMAFLVNKNGRLLAHPDEKRALSLEDVSLNEGVQRALEGKFGGGEFRDELGVQMVGAYVPIQKFGWGIVVQEPLVSAYSELRRLETNSLLFVVVGIVLTALVGIFFARSIERPIKELTRATEAVSNGDLHWHIGTRSTDEIGKLTQAFDRMTRDLRDSQEKLVLSEKLGSLGTMAAGMAHEIKNPLVSIRTFTQILQQKWDDKEFRDKFASLIPHEIERINRIAESLLKFGRPMKPELSRVDLAFILDEVLLLFESECKKNNIRVTKKFAELPEITGDAGQLQQVLVNIVKHAIEAIGHTGGSLIVKTDVGVVTSLGKMDREGQRRGEEMVWGEGEKLEKPLPVVFIEVADSGEGISDENLKVLFDPFFTTKMTGTGMGLPITLRIVEEHRGSIKVRSKKGHGTSFIITLPQA